MPDTPKPPASTPSPSTTSTAMVGRLLDAQEKDRDRDEREHAAMVATLERQATLWQRTALALIVVLAMLVAGVVGVGVSGSLPGVGEIQIVKPGKEPTPTPTPTPEPTTAPRSPGEAQEATE